MQEVLNRLKRTAQKDRCADVETSGLDWKRNHIVGYVVTFSPNPADSYYVPFRHLGDKNVGGRHGPRTATGWDSKLAPGEAELVAELDKPGTTLFGHHIAFDCRFMSKTGFAMQPRLEDTQINEPLLNEFAGKFSLEACADRYGVQGKKSKEIIDYLCSLFPEARKNPRSAMGHFWRLSGDDPIANDYAKGDGTSTWQLRDKQMDKIRAVEEDPCLSRRDNRIYLPTLELVHDIESRLIPVLVRMMVRGIKVDQERLEWLADRIKKRQDRLLNDFPSNFNPLDRGAVEAWMVKHGCTDWPYTLPSMRFPDGQPSFNEKWLEKHAAGKMIIDLRKINNLENTFFLPLRDEHMFNGRVHTEFNQLKSDDYGTITGRLSSSKPNMQQVPKHNADLGKLFRSVFVPDDGMIWGERDYSQIEPRLLAYYTRCKVLLEDYRNNPKADAHTAATIAMLGQGKWDTMTKDERKFQRDTRGKRVNQTLVTGGGRGVLVEKYGIDPSEVNKIWNDYFDAMPEIQPFQKKSGLRFKQRGFLLSLLNRRARLRSSNLSYTGTNRLLQCGNADIIKLKMVEVDEHLEAEKKAGNRPNVDLLNNCHDALTFQFDETSRAVYDHCKDIMTDFGPNAVIKLDVPVTVDEGEGPNWAIATYGDFKDEDDDRYQPVGMRGKDKTVSALPGKRKKK